MPSPLTNLRLLILHISHSQLWWALYLWQSKHLKWRLREWVGSNYKRQYEGRCKCDFGWTWGIDLPSSIPGKLLTSNYCTLVHFCSVFTMLLYTSIEVTELSTHFTPGGWVWRNPWPLCRLLLHGSLGRSPLFIHCFRCVEEVHTFLFQSL